MAAASRNRKKGSFEILFIGYNSVSIPFAYSLLTKGVENIAITFYHEDNRESPSDRNVRSAQAARKGSRHGSRRDSSFVAKSRRRTGSVHSRTYSTTSAVQQNSTPTQSSSQVSELGAIFETGRLATKKPRVISSFASLSKGKKLNRVKFIFFASSTAFLNSKKASQLKKHLANNCSPDAVWVRLGVNPETRCLLTGNQAMDSERYYMTAMPLYTVLKNPAGKDAAVIEYWHESKGRVWPIHMSSLQQEAPEPKIVPAFFRLLESKGIMVNRLPPVPQKIGAAARGSNNVNKQRELKKRIKEYKDVIALQLDVSRRHWCLPLYLLIEFDAWSVSMKSAKGKRGVSKDNQVDREELLETMYAAFLELQGMDKGVFDIFNSFTYSFEYVSSIKEVMEQVMRGSKDKVDNSSSADMLDAFGRINELRHELLELVKKQKSAVACRDLVKRTDVTTKYGNKRIWNQRDLAYIYQ